jgi:hypothetical protein
MDLRNEGKGELHHIAAPPQALDRQIRPRSACRTSPAIDTRGFEGPSDQARKKLESAGELLNRKLFVQYFLNRNDSDLEEGLR